MEATIAKAAKQAEENRRRSPRWRDRAPGAIDTSLTVITVEPAIWEVALRLADHPRNIQILNQGEVIVWNHGPPWPSGKTE